MNRKNPATRLMIIRELLNHLFDSWTARHGAWTRDKLMKDLEKELKERRRTGSYAGAPTPLCLSAGGRGRAGKKGGVECQ